MRYLCALFSILMIFASCHPYPRYRTGEARPPGEEKVQRQVDRRYESANAKKLKTGSSKLIELGRIIQSYLGTPYKGTSPYKKGIDCSQFTAAVYKKFNGTKLPRMARKQFNVGQQVSGTKLRYGDLVFFRTDGRSISHVGIYIGYNEFVHASTSSGVRISDIRSEYWKNRFVGARRIIR
jgi:cell wall-associated NlpC family hydrolase